MELTLKLEDSADITFLKQLLSQLEGVKSISLNDDKIDLVKEESAEYIKSYKSKHSANELDEEEMPEDEYEILFNQLLDKSFEQFQDGNYKEFTPEFIEEKFKI